MLVGTFIAPLCFFICLFYASLGKHLDLTRGWGRNANFQRATKSPFPMPLCKGHKLEDASVDEIQGWYDKGTLRIADVVQCYIERIHQVDSNVRFVIPTRNTIPSRYQR